MKATMKVIDYLEADIKKNFFNLKRADFFSNIEKGKKSSAAENNSGKNEELSSFYTTTTRWQTL